MEWTVVEQKKVFNIRVNSRNRFWEVRSSFGEVDFSCWVEREQIGVARFFKVCFS